MGNLVPIMLLECIPGDTHTISCESLLRFAPLISPVMHRYDVTMHYFFVPNRLVWSNWEKFITNTIDDETGLLPVFPTMTFGPQDVQIASLADYLGIPVNLNTEPGDLKVSAIPFAAYQAIYSEYYRDQNLIAPISYKLNDGNYTPNNSQFLLTLRKRAWEHDYFTACLPFAQKGAPVEIPLGNVELKNVDNPQQLPLYRIVNGQGADPGTGSPLLEFATQGTAALTDSDNNPLAFDPNGSLQVEPTSINDLRRAFKLQEWLEKAARGGSRYIEWLKVMFGVNSPDKRLQRPEYITGTTSPVIISEILNTSGSSAGVNGALPQGNMSGHAVSVTNGQYGKYYVEEHGYIMGIMSVMPKPAYFQGTDRTWFKGQESNTDFYFSSFANIGEQSVTTDEIYSYSDDVTTFGYIPRYAEYRYQANRVCGNFRTDLNFWHQARIFSEKPNLNADFVTCDPDKRIFAVTDAGVNSLYVQVYNKVMSVRPIPKYGTPTF
jgi:hypothetical protein